eukprot:549244_1
MSHDLKHSCWNATPRFQCLLIRPTGTIVATTTLKCENHVSWSWTNTCCSHPLANAVEMPKENSLDARITGVKHAAIRKLEHELGITKGLIGLGEFRFLTRIHYRSATDSKEWGEHEIDYILFAQKEVPLASVPNEVQ